MIHLALLALLAVSALLPDAFAQTINVTATEPCFLNYTAGVQMWANCGMDEDYIQGALIGFEWVTGGWFSLILAIILILFTYIKYHKTIYPMIVGIAFIPIIIFLVPGTWQTPVLILVGLVLGFAAYKIFKNHTSDFG